ncbi:hypothetical protein, partial [Alienimonas sp. DA493]|uniref:hypothetical protein n=1 Tax=Alienimonas sp. DA493 TaxID=3373605 RepID=UPI0037553D0D
MTVPRRTPPDLTPRPIRLPANPPNVGPVDVVTPFAQADEKFLAVSVAAALDQPGCEPLLHLVADGFTPSPETIALAEHPSVRLYVNERNVGPYV